MAKKAVTKKTTKKKTAKKRVAQSTKKARPNPSRDFKPTQSDVADAFERAKTILSKLKKLYPDAQCELAFVDPLQLLIATILSAQCTDERVNKVTPVLFKRCRNARDFSQIPQSELEEIIKSTGFYRNKAKHIIEACSTIVDEHAGKVPSDLGDLTALPGVGRKTANVIRGNAYGLPAVVTDTHVLRLSRLLGLTLETDPVKVEMDLMELLPKKDWTLAGHLLIFHGRRMCIAARPKCPECDLRSLCSFACGRGDS